MLSLRNHFTRNVRKIIVGLVFIFTLLTVILYGVSKYLKSFEDYGPSYEDFILKSNSQITDLLESARKKFNARRALFFIYSVETGHHADLNRIFRIPVAESVADDVSPGIGRVTQTSGKESPLFLVHSQNLCLNFPYMHQGMEVTWFACGTNKFDFQGRVIISFDNDQHPQIAPPEEIYSELRFIISEIEKLSIK